MSQAELVQLLLSMQAYENLIFPSTSKHPQLTVKKIYCLGVLHWMTRSPLRVHMSSDLKVTLQHLLQARPLSDLNEPIRTVSQPVTLRLGHG
ncbi:hypothetical protein C8P63_11494 [Melghirimyces profundicolus]|uniref:Uncharacterized protein n=1 Tax=Melghirimyces profundicolus TaxID=1242148 RepID=A0A2T6BS66_9BACL|nr:hypothetical protein [Melghirimyces profundicolus]PTX58912.1 hypothetical protein C8P63_11494 [Melghirimyces profundicolus]